MIYRREILIQESNTALQVSSVYLHSTILNRILRLMMDLILSLAF